MKWEGGAQTERQNEGAEAGGAEVLAPSLHPLPELQSRGEVWG